MFRRTASALALVAVTVWMLAAVAPAGARTTRCGSFSFSGGKVSVYRIKGTASCSTGKRIAKSAIGSRCNGGVVRDGWRCTRGARTLGEPAASGFTLTKGRTRFEARVR